MYLQDDRRLRMDRGQFGYFVGSSLRTSSRPESSGDRELTNPPARCKALDTRATAPHSACAPKIGLRPGQGLGLATPYALSHHPERILLPRAAKPRAAIVGEIYLVPPTRRSTRRAKATRTTHYEIISSHLRCIASVLSRPKEIAALGEVPRIIFYKKADLIRSAGWGLHF